jgi:hypothetical protein
LPVDAAGPRTRIGDGRTDRSGNFDISAMSEPHLADAAAGNYAGLE